MRWSPFALPALVLACAADGPMAPPAQLQAPAHQSVIVTLRDSVRDVPGTARRLSAVGQLRFTYTHALRGFAAELPAPAIDALRHRPEVAAIEADQIASINGTQSPVPSWGLDRIDDRVGLDNSYVYATTGAGVNVYIIDTGIRTTHQDFGGRAAGAVSTVKGKASTEDCHGHGTHVAGTVGGGVFGVAKQVRLYAVRVLDCDGTGAYSQVIAGIDWVTAHRVRPAVANMSLGGGKSQALNDAVAGSIAAGVTYAVAAGNNNLDACLFSPASAPAALTIAAADKVDAQAYFSNWGTCTDLYAPGVAITSDWATSDVATNTISGTSMATPHVAGAAALYLAAHATASPATVASALLAAATQGRLTGLRTGSPNRLLFTGDPATPQPSPVSGGKGCGNAWWKKC